MKLNGCFMLIALVMLLASCDKKDDIVLPDSGKPCESTFSFDPDHFSITADSSAQARLDSNQSFGYTYAKLISLTAKMQMDFAGSLTLFSNASNKVKTEESREAEKKKESLLAELWKSIAWIIAG